MTITSHSTDLNLSVRDISALASVDALAGFLTSLGYDTSRRNSLTPEAIGLAGESAAPIRAIEVLAEDTEGFLRVVFVQLRSLTAKSRNDLARVLGRTNIDHLLILVSDFDTLEFVLLDKRRRQTRGPVDVQRIQVVPLSLAVQRKSVGSRQLRTVRRFTWTGRDGLEQFDKLRSVFEAAAFSEDYFCNRALFADHYLLTRLREDAAWRDNPTAAFQSVKQLLADARQRWLGKTEQIVREQLYEPLFTLLGFQATVNKGSVDAHTKSLSENRPPRGEQAYIAHGASQNVPVPDGSRIGTNPDYLLEGSGGKTAAFVYAWDRWLDGPDFNLDQQTPEENPGACVVTALEEGVADWIIMTNGRQWRLYSRHAHSRATNFYEVDLAEALVASGDTDPNEAFRYWWLFFRAGAFAPAEGTHGADKNRWLDVVAEGSREYAKQLGERLKQRIFETIFPHLAQGFLEDRKRRLGTQCRPTDEELHDIHEATLTLLYRLLFLLYAESRDLLPIREAPYRAASLTKIKEEIAEKAGIAETEAGARLAKAYAANNTGLYDRLQRLCEAMDRGDPALNVPIYNGGLFVTRPGESDAREQRIARFLSEHKTPDRFLAPAIDRLSRDPDDKTLSLVFIDYKSLEVRHLGSIYEGLLEFKLRVADEDLTTTTEKGKEKFLPLATARTKRGKSADIVVPKGEVYLSNDKAERKASGSYYTPDAIVEYIVEQTVGPVLSEKLETLRGELRKVRKTFDNELGKLKVPPLPEAVRTEAISARDFAAGKTYEAHRDIVEQIFDFRTLDPAMGSGHFLVEAVDFITDHLLTFLNQFPINPVSFMLDRTRRNILEALGEQGITVDPDKLTEVNLLKRHVLKRCIYGVDLNPMAVELAKVSLWLDAFTIGAPLSFLDHHLRCGNSLVGATFKELAAATKGQLFSIDYEPLLRAIRHVIQVNQMADATAAEAKKSASEYGLARDELSGYQIVLDLLVARHFGFPKAPGLLEHGKDLDLTNRSQFLESLEGLEELALVEKVSAMAGQPDRRFFHWEIEFPEVFFAFADSDERRLKHKNEVAEGSAGFDAVVGNPPYDVLASKEVGADLDEVLRFFRSSPSYLPAMGGKLNLYKLFVSSLPRLLRIDGQGGMIVPMPLVADRQARGLRHLLLGDMSVKAIEAFPEHLDASSRVFEEANLTTCIFVVVHRPTALSAPICVRVNRGATFDESVVPTPIYPRDIIRLDPDGLTIPNCGTAEWEIVTSLLKLPWLEAMGDRNVSYQGEVNETMHREFLCGDRGIVVLRGAHICRYAVRDSWRSNDLRLNVDRFLRDGPAGEKSTHHRHDRIGFQRSAPQNNFRRLIAAPIGKNSFCFDTVSYFLADDSALGPELLMAFLNSEFLDWYFDLGSTNSKINEYRLNQLPIPRFAPNGYSPNGRPVSNLSAAANPARLADECRLALANPTTFGAQLPALVSEGLKILVRAACAAENARLLSSHRQRSALGDEAQPLQMAIDDIVFECYAIDERQRDIIRDSLRHRRREKNT